MKVYKKQQLWQIKNKMQKDQVRIVKLYGTKGEIPEKEYTKIASQLKFHKNSLTNYKI